MPHRRRGQQIQSLIGSDSHTGLEEIRLWSLLFLVLLASMLQTSLTILLDMGFAFLCLDPSVHASRFFNAPTVLAGRLTFAAMVLSLFVCVCEEWGNVWCCLPLHECSFHPCKAEGAGPLGYVSEVCSLFVQM